MHARHPYGLARVARSMPKHTPDAAQLAPSLTLNARPRVRLQRGAMGRVVRAAAAGGAGPRRRRASLSLSPRRAAPAAAALGKIDSSDLGVDELDALGGLRDQVGEHLVEVLLLKV